MRPPIVRKRQLVQTNRQPERISLRLAPMNPRPGKINRLRGLMKRSRIAQHRLRIEPNLRHARMNHQLAPMRQCRISRRLRRIVRSRRLGRISPPRAQTRQRRTSQRLLRAARNQLRFAKINRQRVRTKRLRRNLLLTEHRRPRAKILRNKHRQRRRNPLLIHQRLRQKSRIRHRRKRSQNLPRIRRKKRTKNQRSSGDSLLIHRKAASRNRSRLFSRRDLSAAQQASRGRGLRVRGNYVCRRQTGAIFREHLEIRRGHRLAD